MAAVELIEPDDAEIIIVSDKGYVLRFLIDEINLLKKTAKGEKAMKLSQGEALDNIYLIRYNENKDKYISVKGGKLPLSRIKSGHRNERGSRYKL